MMKKIKVWYMIQDSGDGSAIVLFFLTEEMANKCEKVGKKYGGFAESTVYFAETYEGSNIHKEAVENEEDKWLTEGVLK